MNFITQNINVEIILNISIGIVVGITLFNLVSSLITLFVSKIFPTFIMRVGRKVFSINFRITVLDRNSNTFLKGIYKCSIGGGENMMLRIEPVTKMPYFYELQKKMIVNVYDPSCKLKLSGGTTKLSEDTYRINEYELDPRRARRFGLFFYNDETLRNYEIFIQIIYDNKQYYKEKIIINPNSPCNPN